MSKRGSSYEDFGQDNRSRCCVGQLTAAESTELSELNPFRPWLIMWMVNSFTVVRQQRPDPKKPELLTLEEAAGSAVELYTQRWLQQDGWRGTKPLFHLCDDRACNS